MICFEPPRQVIAGRIEISLESGDMGSALRRRCRTAAPFLERLIGLQPGVVL